MFFILSKILFFLINPLLWIVVLFVLSLILKQDKIKKVCLYSGIFLLIFLSNPIISNILLKYWEPKGKSKDELPLTDVAVVLTGMLELDKDPNDQLHFNSSADRITESLSLKKLGVVSTLLLSGGNGSLLDNKKREGTLLSRLINSYGVASHSILVDPESRNTHENAVYTKELLKDNGLEDRPIILVTSAFHMPRAIACFEKEGIDSITYPVDFRQSSWTLDIQWVLPDSESLLVWNMILKEWVGILAYKLAGYI